MRCRPADQHQQLLIEPQALSRYAQHPDPKLPDLQAQSHHISTLTEAFVVDDKATRVL